MVSCFDYTTNMAKPWAEAGYTCLCVDTRHPYGWTVEGNIIKIRADVLSWTPPYDASFAAFFPPCTDVAASGARWFKDKGIGSLIRALQLFERSVQIAQDLDCPYMIENPVSTVSTYWRKPDHMFHPYDYGDPYPKKTCLWTGGGFVMPSKTPVAPTDDRIHQMPQSPNRAEKRSATPMGFAKAVYHANRI
jgi:hypothetical protein